MIPVGQQRRHRTVAASWFVFASLMVVGCMGERGAVNRVQPDYLDKEQLIPVEFAALQRGVQPGALTEAQIRREPQWYHQVTIIDKPATTGATGISWYTQLRRVNFEITQDFLIARSAVEQLHGGSNCPSTGCIGQNPRQGEIVAVYAIQSHFDIRRSYNASTGEEQNIVEENTQDRPWYQRRYIRVDWSRNLVSGYSVFQFAEWQGRVRAEPVATYFNNPEDPNRPVFEYARAEGRDNVLRYFDVTNRTVLHPEDSTIAIPGYPNLPACALYDRITESCAPSDVLTRVAFFRVDRTRDYAPQSLDGHRMERFGYFTADRHGLNAHLGTPGQPDRRYFSARHNLWMQHHARPEDRATNPAAAGALHHQTGDIACERDDQCLAVSDTARCDAATHSCGETYIRCSNDMDCNGVGFGTSCDVDIAYTRPDNTGLCLLPYRRRTVRPLAYHLSPNYPERIMPVTREVVREWNRVFSHAVNEARYRECLLDRADPGSGAADRCQHWRTNDPSDQASRDGRFVYIGCHTPVWGTDRNLPGFHEERDVQDARAAGWDLDACGPQGTMARLGDIRYNMIAAINDYDMQGSWGLAGITGDPATGEVISGRGAVWQTVTDASAAWVTDVIRILNRDENPERIALGQTVIDAYEGISGRNGRDEHASWTVPTNPRPVHRDFTNLDEVNNILSQTRFDHLQTVAPRAGVGSEQANRLPPQGLDIWNLSAESTWEDGRQVTRHTDRAFNLRMANYLRDRLPNVTPGNDPQSRMNRIRDTSIENIFANREELLGAGIDPRLNLTPAAISATSPARQNNFAYRTMISHLHQELDAMQCNMEHTNAFADDVLTVLLQRFRDNRVPGDVTFGQDWNFHVRDRAACPADVAVGNCALNYDEIQRYLVQYIHYGVLAHELGHAIGERHNFSGSADAVNYFDRYWQLRGYAGRPFGMPPTQATEIRPRWEHMARGQPFYSFVEQREGVEEYGYSSVMDYKGVNEDAHGLGRYDRAFVLHGYVDMVEAFDRVDNFDDALNAFELMTGGFQSGIRLTFNGGAGASARPTTFHYTDIPRIVGTVNVPAPDPMNPSQMTMVNVPNVLDSNRYTVFLRETARRSYNAVGWDADHSNVATANRDGTPGMHVVVPYRFGTDNWANYVWNTQRYDAGADMFESMRYVSQHYLDYYFLNSFARNRSTFTVNGYRARMEGRYLEQMYYSMRNFVYVMTIYQNAYGPTLTGFSEFLDTPSVRTGRLATATVIDTLANAVMMPEANAIYPTEGRHYLTRRADSTTVWSPDFQTGVSTVDVPIGAGREFSTYFDFASGFYWRERMVNAGAYHDKLLSLQHLTDTFVWVPGRSVIDLADVHPMQINMYTIYPAQTLRFFGSILSRDHDDVAPQVRPRGDSEPQILRTQVSLLNLPWGVGAGRNGRDPTLSAIDPNMGFTVELETAVYLFTHMGSTFDRTAMLNCRLWMEGDRWELPGAPGRSFAEFVDPFTQTTFRALHVGGAPTEPGAAVGLSRRDQARNETGIAARMLHHANDLVTAWRAAAANEEPQRRRELQNYIDLLSIMRDLNRVFEGGNSIGNRTPSDE